MIRILALNLIFGLYISYRIYRAFFSRFKIYFAMPVIFVFAQLFFVLKLITTLTGVYISDGLMTVSYIMLGLAVYALVYFLIFDILWLLRVRIKFIHKSRQRVGLIVAALTFATFAYGYYHHLDTQITYYNLDINKPLKEPLKIAVISDIHIGSSMTAERLEKYADTINSLNPHIILVAGDIIDSDLRALTDEFRVALNRLDAPMGVYGVLGNHEYFSGNIDEVISALEDSGIEILKDETVFFEDKGVYLMGRDSMRHSVSKGNERMAVPQLAEQIDNTKPVIIMDHIPKNITDGKELQADLQISGHTHGGQFFPITEIVKQIYPIGYGHLKDGDFNLIVTSGLGLWGPPMRVGSDSEIVFVTISGNQ
ncbi:MAG: metallophosphoesterase [Deferribacterales bacterium]|nr:metallophosphoesterase [Deferribacterales bacterium]